LNAKVRERVNKETVRERGRKSKLTRKINKSRSGSRVNQKEKRLNIIAFVIGADWCITT